MTPCFLRLIKKESRGVGPGIAKQGVTASFGPLFDGGLPLCTAGSQFNYSRRNARYVNVTARTEPPCSSQRPVSRILVL
jgi:hypothetical protein